MSLFQLLGAGAKFNRKKFEKDFKVFNFSSNEPSSVDASTSETVAQDLDFFNPFPQFADKKRKTTNSEDEQSKKAKLDKITFEQVADFTSNEDVQAFRKKNRIKVYGSDVPNPIQNFGDLIHKYKIRNYLQQNLVELSYSEPTSIQMQTIPILLHGREVMACAPTGSGKTLAFILPILHELNGPAKEGFRAVIVSPTRELAQQIYRETKKLATGKAFKICVLTKSMNTGDTSAAQQLEKFDILITTPMRVVQAIQQNTIKLNHVRFLVLDEADKLLELNFLDQVDEILAACSNPKLLKALFSATIPSGVETLASTFMTDPIRVVIGQKDGATETIKQELMYVGQEEGKLIAIRQMIKEGRMCPPVLIFVQSIERAKELFHEIVYDGISVDVMHSERTKAQRDAIVNNFRSGKLWVLIATELMARGIDFKGVNLVINYDFPQSVASYIHRIGRTGRAGKSGEAVTFFTKDDAVYLKSVVNVMRSSGCDVPEWMLSLKKPSKMIKKELKKKAPERKSISTVSGYDKSKTHKKKQMIEASKKRKEKETEDI
ncbi:RNA-dependent ATPase rok1 [Nowakowskiella sp. JEL0407]|nr:RNA-dependent ATPase rok1 [Nowakowskiella sp. JEL0407]